MGTNPETAMKFADKFSRVEGTALIGPMMGVGTLVGIWYLDRLLPVELKQRGDEVQIVVKPTEFGK